MGVRGQRPEEIEYAGSAESLQQVWIALRANLRKVLEHVTVADVAAGKLPKDVLALTKRRGSLGNALSGVRREDAGRGRRTARIWPSLSSSSWASSRVTWAQMLAPVVQLQLDAHLEAEVHDPLDERLGRRCRRPRAGSGCRGGARTRRRGG